MRDYPSFLRLVHEVYPRLHDRAFLQDHPLTRLLSSSGSPFSAERLHRTLIDAIEWLRPIGAASPSSVAWRRYTHLQLRYVEGQTPEQIAQQLQISPRQARRDHVEALNELARLLWTQPGRPSPLGAERSAPLRAPRTTPPDPRARVVSSKDSLDVEISSLKATAPTQPSDIGVLVSGVVGTISRLANANAVPISISAPESLESIVVDRTVLRQILLNLLSEAIVKRPGDQIQIDIDPREHSLDIRISVRHYRGAAAPTGETLPMEGMRAGVWSTAIEISTRLAHSLGAVLRSEERPMVDAVCLTLPLGHASTVLLVDDNPDVALLFRRYLADTEYQLVQARSAERALRLARELRPELVILDVLMPAHDGWEILQALRGEPTTAHIPVVICSVIPDHALAYSLGVADFLSKPVNRSALLEVLSRLGHSAVVGGREGLLEPTDIAHPRAILPAD